MTWARKAKDRYDAAEKHISTLQTGAGNSVINDTLRKKDS